MDRQTDNYFLSVCLSVSLYIYTYMSLSLSLSLSVTLSVSVCLSFCHSVCLAVCLSLSRSLYLCLCLSLSLALSPSHTHSIMACSLINRWIHQNFCYLFDHVDIPFSGSCLFISLTKFQWLLGVVGRQEKVTSIRYSQSLHSYVKPVTCVFYSNWNTTIYLYSKWQAFFSKPTKTEP